MVLTAGLRNLAGMSLELGALFSLSTFPVFGSMEVKKSTAALYFCDTFLAEERAPQAGQL